MAKTIDLNCDMGESYGAYRMGMDEAVIKHITSANIACGWHAGDPLVMNTTVRMAIAHGVGVGAHPGHPDLRGFGRRQLESSSDEIRNDVIYQLGALNGFCRVHGTRLCHVKPHGALYHAAVSDEAVARAVAEAIVSLDPELSYIALAGARGEMMTRVGREVGLRVVHEAFPDRAYTPEGNLLPRQLPGAVIEDPQQVAARALTMAKEGVVKAVDGSTIPLSAQTLCVHGDTPSAVELVVSIRSALEREGITLGPLGAFREPAGCSEDDR